MRRRIRSIIFYIGIVGLTGVLGVLLANQVWVFEYKFAPNEYVELKQGSAYYSESDVGFEDGEPPLRISRIHRKQDRGLIWSPRFFRLPMYATSVTIPLWPLSILFACMTYWGWRRRGSSPVSQCEACGYPTSGLRTSTCPECGNSLTQMNASSVGDTTP